MHQLSSNYFTYEHQRGPFGTRSQAKWFGGPHLNNVLHFIVFIYIYKAFQSPIAPLR